jgi:hypothetical protein
LIFLAGCFGGNYKEKLEKIRPNMSKDELRLIMKEPGVIRSSVVGKDGKLTEIWEYTFSSNILSEEEPKTFYFEFVDDRLIKWGKQK